MIKRIFRNFIVIALLALVSSACLFFGVLYNYFGAKISSELQEQTAYLAQGLTNEGAPYLDGLNTVNRITWIDTDGTVLYDSQRNVSELENHSDRQEVIDAIKNGRGTSERYSETLSEKTTYYAQRMNDGTVIRIANSQQTIWNLLYSMLPFILIVLIAVFVISAVLSSRLSKRIVKPINEIDLEHPEKNEVYEELAPLLTKINSLKNEVAKEISKAEQRQLEFSMITKNMSEGLIITDSETNILSYNASILKFFSPHEGIKNKSVLTLNRSEKFRNAIHLALEGQHSDQVLIIDGNYYQMITNPVYKGYDVTGVILIIIDVTEKERRESMRREFTSNVSHELKTPLTGIYGTAEIIMNGMVKPEDVAKFAGNIHDESGRLISVVNDIIKISQLDENLIPDEKMPVDLYALSENVIKYLDNKAQEHKVTVKLTGVHASVTGNDGILEEMLYNLCDNAIKYNRPGGSVVVSVNDNEEKITLSVADNGIGISPKHKDRVFERFYRVDKSRSKDIGGTGLGLSIAKHVALYHGAEITLESREHEGTAVTVTFKKVK